jgi:hypothetical protein
MLKTKTINKTTTTVLILLLTLSLLCVSNFIAFVPKVEASPVTSGAIYVNASKTTPTWGDGNGSLSNPYWNITSALTNCVGNAVIHVGPGTYNSTLETFPLTISQTNVTIASTNGPANTNITAIDSTTSGYAFNITASNATIGGSGVGFTIWGGGWETAHERAHVIDVNASYATIQNNTIVIYETNTAGIHFVNGSNQVGQLVKGNTFRNRKAGEGWGIFAENLTSSVIRDNLWYGDNQTWYADTGWGEGAPGTCIIIADADNVNITDNTAYNVKYTWLVFYAAYPKLLPDDHNNIYEHPRNATITKIWVTNNTIHDCQTAVNFHISNMPSTHWADDLDTANLTIGANVNIGPGNNFYTNRRGITIDGNLTGTDLSNACVFGAEGLVINYNNIYNNSARYSTDNYGVRNSQSKTVNATLNWWGNASGPGYTSGVGGLGTGDNVSDPTYVQYVPWLNAAYPGGVSTTPFSITPTATKGSVTKWFNITVQNIGSPAAVDYVNVTYPSSFTLYTYKYSAGWTQSHDATGKTVNFIATGGYELNAGQTARFDFQMSASTSSGDFKILCRNLMGGKGYQNLTVSVDATPPTVSITAPTVTYYTVGAGNKIWINGTITDDTYNTPSVAINDTTYFPLTPQIGPTYASATTYSWNFSYYNTSAVPDGYLAVNLTGTDAAGNVMSSATPVGTTIDNTSPTIISFAVKDDKIGSLTAVGSTIYMSANASGLNFNVTFAESHGYTNMTYISNSTVTTTQSFTNNTWFYTLENTALWYNVTGMDTITINNITITDAAQPNNNTLVTGSYTIIRDLIPPGVPTFTVTPVCGGLVIKNLNSTDNVGVLNYQIYVNGTTFLNVTVTDLATATLVPVDLALNTSYAFNGALVLNLTNYAGNYANLTIRAVDVGGNVGNFSTPTVYTIPQGQWYPIELQPDWNLLGLPLIPADTSRAAVLSLILKQGASGVIVYGYNSATSTFTLNPATMTDGNGYWIYMAAYDVMIVSGRVSAPPPALPPNYNLVTGWNLAGYKSTIAHNVSSYLASLPSASYFTYIYVWDPSAQTWLMASGSQMLSPGQGFWIYMYSDQTLIPPIP